MEESPTPYASLFDVSGLFILLFTLCGFVVPMLLVNPPVPPRESDWLLQSHTKLGLDASKSKRASGPPTPRLPRGAEEPAAIEELWIYPIKSCKGIQLSRSKVLATGLELDRLFTFAQLKGTFPAALDSSDEEKGSTSWHFITQRQFPLLATLEVELWQPDVAKFHRTTTPKANEAFLIVRFPWQEDGFRGRLSWIAAKLVGGIHAQPEKEVLLPVEFPPLRDINQNGYTFEDVTIWKDTITALNMAADLPPELRLYLGVSNKLGLFRLDPGRLREVHRCAPSRAEAGYQPVTGFQDAVRATKLDPGCAAASYLLLTVMSIFSIHCIFSTPAA
jgi:hypothetical protein